MDVPDAPAPDEEEDVDNDDEVPSSDEDPEHAAKHKTARNTAKLPRSARKGRNTMWNPQLVEA